MCAVRRAGLGSSGRLVFGRFSSALWWGPCPAENPSLHLSAVGGTRGRAAERRVSGLTSSCPRTGGRIGRRPTPVSARAKSGVAPVTRVAAGSGARLAARVGSGGRGRPGAPARSRPRADGPKRGMGSCGQGAGGRRGRSGTRGKAGCMRGRAAPDAAVPGAEAPVRRARYPAGAIPHTAAAGSHRTARDAGRARTGSSSARGARDPVRARWPDLTVRADSRDARVSRGRRPPCARPARRGCGSRSRCRPSGCSRTARPR